MIEANHPAVEANGAPTGINRFGDRDESSGDSELSSRHGHQSSDKTSITARLIPISKGSVAIVESSMPTGGRRPILVTTALSGQNQRPR
jgi:hypothetical protein